MVPLVAIPLKLNLRLHDLPVLLYLAEDLLVTRGQFGIDKAEMREQILFHALDHLLRLDCAVLALNSEVLLARCQRTAAHLESRGRLVGAFDETCRVLSQFMARYHSQAGQNGLVVMLATEVTIIGVS